ncbi:type II/IV secretion system protein, partial [bacterium]|nr:type II/IV secretion system protein [bacterium]
AGIVSQRLARRICPSCRTQREATGAERKLLRLDEGVPATISEGKGCGECGGFGMKGRRVVYELLTMNEEIAEAVAKGGDEAAILDAARRNGFATIREHARDLVLAGEISLDAMTRVVA